MVPELMDDPAIDPVEHRRALCGLRRVNAICQTGKHIANEIQKIANDRLLDSISVLDLGCGSGDIATNVGHRLADKIYCKIHGWDISPTAIAFAKEFDSKSKEQRLSKGRSSLDIQYQQTDVFAETSQKFDVVYCCLFLHHFPDDQAIKLASRMKELATKSVLIDDLNRTTLGLILATIGCHLLSRSPVVHFDGPQSVRAAFRDSEARNVAEKAGMNLVTIKKHWPERFLLRWDSST